MTTLTIKISQKSDNLVLVELAGCSPESHASYSFEIPLFPAIMSGMSDLENFRKELIAKTIAGEIRNLLNCS